MIDRKLLKVINFILLIIRILNVFYFETASTFSVDSDNEKLVQVIYFLAVVGERGRW